MFTQSNMFVMWSTNTWIWTNLVRPISKKWSLITLRLLKDNCRSFITLFMMPLISLSLILLFYIKRKRELLSCLFRKDCRRYLVLMLLMFCLNWSSVLISKMGTLHISGIILKPKGKNCQTLSTPWYWTCHISVIMIRSQRWWNFVKSAITHWNKSIVS